MEEQKKIQILTDYHIRHSVFNDTLELCLDDFVQYIVGSKSIQSYLAKIKDKTKRNGLYYKDAEITILELCPKLRSKQAKQFYEQWESLKNKDSNNDTPTTESSSITEEEG